MAATRSSFVVFFEKAAAIWVPEHLGQIQNVSQDNFDKLFDGFQEYTYALPLIRSFEKAFHDGNIDSWFDLAKGKMVDDLFNSNGNLKSDIEELFNQQKTQFGTPLLAGLISEIMTKQKTDRNTAKKIINTWIAKAYLLKLFIEPALKNIKNKNELEQAKKQIERFLHDIENEKVDSVFIKTAKQNNAEASLLIKIDTYKTVKEAPVTFDLDELAPSADLHANEYLFEPKKNTDVKVTNIVIIEKELSQNNWVYKKEGDRNELLIDANRGMKINGKRWKKESDSESENEISLKRFIKDNISPEVDSEKVYKDVKRYYSQVIGNFIGSTIEASVIESTIDSPMGIQILQHRTPDETKLEMKALYKKYNLPLPETTQDFHIGKDGVFLTISQSNFGLYNPEKNELLSLPGNVTYQFELTKNGFQLTFVACTNELLNSLFLHDKVEDFQGKIQLAIQEEYANEEARKIISPAVLNQAPSIKIKEEKEEELPNSNLLNEKDDQELISDTEASYFHPAKTFIDDSEVDKLLSNDFLKEEPTINPKIRVNLPDGSVYLPSDPEFGIIKKQPNFFQRNWGVIAGYTAIALLMAATIATCFLFPPAAAALGTATAYVAGTVLGISVGVVAATTLAAVGTAIVGGLAAAALSIGVGIRALVNKIKGPKEEPAPEPMPTPSYLKTSSEKIREGLAEKLSPTHSPDISRTASTSSFENRKESTSPTLRRRSASFSFSGEQKKEQPTSSLVDKKKAPGKRHAKEE